MSEMTAEGFSQEVDRTPERPAGKFQYRFVMLTWFLYLFEPARLIAHYVPWLFPLRWIPTGMILIAALFWYWSPDRKWDRKFAAVVGLTFVGTIVAFVDGNWGISRGILREIFQFFMLGAVTLTFVDNEKRIRGLLFLYFWYFVFYAIWGIAGLKTAPIEQFADPGVRHIVIWHPWLDNRDGFGPLMVMGMAFSFYLIRAVKTWKTKALGSVCLWLCLIGIVLSFGRGVFVAMLATTGFIWLQMKKKLIGALAIVLLAFLGAIAVLIVSPGSLYWEKMGTIEAGFSEGTGADRWALWNWAWQEFVANPVLGVGTGNYGVYLPRLIPDAELRKAGYSVERVWGRSLHCAPLSILSEYGLVGALIYALVIADFISINRRTRNYLLDHPPEDANEGPPIRNYAAINSAVMACFIAFWVNGIFYEIIYTSFFWHLLILNRLLHVHKASLVPAAAESHSSLEEPRFAVQVTE